MGGNKIVLFAAVAVIAAVFLAWLAAGFVSGNTMQQEKFQQFVSAENPLDKCAVPAGYAEQEWKEHLSHHPDRYAECLK